MKHGKPPRTAGADLGGDVPVVGPREPCPCGSGKRYKVCHGKRSRPADRGYVARPFEGLTGEGDWIALREIVSAATAPVRLADPHAGRDVVVASLLPMALPALVRSGGQILLGLQTTSATGDASADLGHALSRALDADPGATVAPALPGADGPRLQDLLDTSAPFEVTVHETFDFWLEGEEGADADTRSSLEQANAAILPAARLVSVEAAYWCRLGDRDQLRWVVPHDEEMLLDGLARLHARGEDDLGRGTRLLGMFRALGRLVPVWDLVAGTAPEDVEEPATHLAERLSTAVATTSALSADERRARAGLANRQVTIR
ncbi:MAG: DUF5926 family protein [Jiangellaceae bacterium]